MPQKLFHAQPFPLSFDSQTTALIMIDMQRDFVEPGGFGEALGNDVSLVRSAIVPCGKVLKAARDSKLLVIHTRDCAKLQGTFVCATLTNARIRRPGIALP